MSLEVGVNANTAAAQLIIENRVVVDAEIIADQLVLTRQDGAVFSAGIAVGEDGNDFGAPEELVAGINLDDVLDSGAYTQTEVSETTLALNYPVPSPGLLNVMTDLIDASTTWQSYSVYNGTIYAGSVWTRMKYAGVWTPWTGLKATDWYDIPGVNPTGTNEIGVWEHYGGIYQKGQMRITTNKVEYRGLVRYPNGDPLGVYGWIAMFATPVTAPPVMTEYRIAIASTTVLPRSLSTNGTAATTPSGGTSHTHSLQDHVHSLAWGNAGIRIFIDKSSLEPPYTTGYIQIMAGGASDNHTLKPGAICSLAGVHYSWR